MSGVEVRPVGRDKELERRGMDRSRDGKDYPPVVITKGTMLTKRTCGEDGGDSYGGGWATVGVSDVYRSRCPQVSGFHFLTLNPPFFFGRRYKLRGSSLSIVTTNPGL